MRARDDCPRCAELEERVARLEGELGFRNDADWVSMARDAFGVMPKEAAILEQLYRASPHVVSRVRLENATLEPGEEDDRIYSDNLVSVYITRLRKRIGREAIGTAHGHGYYLTAEGAERVRQALAARGLEG